MFLFHNQSFIQITPCRRAGKTIKTIDDIDLTVLPLITHVPRYVRTYICKHDGHTDVTAEIVIFIFLIEKKTLQLDQQYHCW